MYIRGKKPHLDAVLDKMCEIVGAENVDFTAQNWYHQHAWTQAQEDEFTDWLVDYLRKRPAQAELMQYPRGDKKTRVRFADEFCWNFGWKEKK